MAKYYSYVIDAPLINTLLFLMMKIHFASSFCYQKQCYNKHFYICLHSHILFLWDRFQMELLGNGLYLYSHAHMPVLYISISI